MLAIEHRNMWLSDIFAIDWSTFSSVMSENPIHDGFATRNSAVLEKLYRELFPVVKKFVLTNSGSVDDASDVLQDAMVAAWLNVQQGKFTASSKDSLHAYISQIARFKWLDQLKSGRLKYTSRMENIVEPMDSSHEDAGVADDPALYTNKLFAILGDQCKRILSLFYYDKKSLEEIGQVLNYPTESIRTMKYRCMMKLRAEHHKMKESGQA